jgi:hypothetical protein
LIWPGPVTPEGADTKVASLLPEFSATRGKEKNSRESDVLICFKGRILEDYRTMLACD